MCEEAVPVMPVMPGAAAAVPGDAAAVPAVPERAHLICPGLFRIHKTEYC